MTPVRKSVGWIATAIAVVGAAEGLRQNAYPDVVGVPTICYGETRGVRLGDTKSKAECDEMLASRLVEFKEGVDSCVKVPLPEGRRVAFVSLSYNIGVDAFCKSTVVKRINAGDAAGACEAIMMWRFAKGIEFPGLAKRRMVERDLCRRGL